MTDLKALKAFQSGALLDQPTICQLALRGYVLIEEVTRQDPTRPREYRVALITTKGKRLLELA